MKKYVFSSNDNQHEVSTLTIHTADGDVVYNPYGPDEEVEFDVDSSTLVWGATNGADNWNTAETIIQGLIDKFDAILSNSQEPVLCCTITTNGTVKDVYCPMVARGCCGFFFFNPYWIGQVDGGGNPAHYIFVGEVTTGLGPTLEIIPQAHL